MECFIFDGFADGLTPNCDVTVISIPVIEYLNDPSHRAANGVWGTDRCHGNSVINRV